MTVLRVVDPHMHVWDLSTGFYPHFEPAPGGGGDSPMSRSYLYDEYLAEGRGEVEVLKAVLVEAIPTDPVGEADHVQALSDASPIPLGLVAHADLSAERAGEQIASLVERPALRGIRQILNQHPDASLSYVDRAFMDDSGWRRRLSDLSNRGLSFDLQIYPHQMPQASQIASAMPELQFILDHAGMWVDRTLSGWRQWRDGIRLLARNDNVAVKLSGFAMMDADWTVNALRPCVYETLEAFGPERSMFASNFPVDKPAVSFAHLWHAFAATVSDLSEHETAQLFRRTAERIYRI